MTTVTNLGALLAEVAPKPDSPDAFLYGGKTILCYAIVDEIADGYQLADSLPGQYHNGGQRGPDQAVGRLAVLDGARQIRGVDVYARTALPTLTTFVYPEHTLTPRQQRHFISMLVARHPEVTTVVLITTSAVILSDIVHTSIRVVTNPERRAFYEQEDDA